VTNITFLFIIYLLWKKNKQIYKGMAIKKFEIIPKILPRTTRMKNEPLLRYFFLSFKIFLKRGNGREEGMGNFTTNSYLRYVHEQLAMNRERK